MVINYMKKLKKIPYTRELLGIVAIIVASFLAIALCTYNAHDISWFYYNSNPQPFKNAAGAFGAHVAALLLYLCGASSFLFVFCLVWFGIACIKHEIYSIKTYRIISGLTLVLLSCSLCSYYGIDYFGSGTPGGLFGTVIAKACMLLFGHTGSFLFLHTLLLINLVVLLQFSYVSFIQKTIAVVVRSRVVQKSMYFVGTLIQKLSGYAVVPFVWMGRTAMRIYDNSIIGEHEYTVADFETIFLDTAQDQSTQALNDDLLGAPCPTSKVQAATMHVATTADIAKQHEPEPLKPEKSVVKDQQVLKKQEQAYRVPDQQHFIACDTSYGDAKLSKELQMRAKTLEEKLERFGVYGTVTSIKRGPVVTLFEYEPSIDTKVSKIIALEDDLAMALQALSIRIIAPIPGKSVVGFEVANKQRKDVLFANVIHSQDFMKFKGSLPLILGHDTIGNTVIIDLVKTPHLLVAGSTGSGKSVALNAMLVSLLCSRSPEQLKLILIDPKRLEFAAYSDIAHLVFPIITDPKKASPALRWVVQQMEQRYEKMARCGARTIVDYNALVGLHEQVSEPFPFMVVIIDELADLMMTASRDIEDLIARIAQMARACGIHMIIATQRPSVDVITGLIKVNFPSRISFRVTSKIDSRTILDCSGADKLLGRGDMLFLDASVAQLSRVHGAYVTDKEIRDVVQHIRAQQKPNYVDLQEMINSGDMNLHDGQDDQLYNDVLTFLHDVEEVSISLLQRRFRIGFNRSARIIECLEKQGRLVSFDGGKTRKVVR